MNYLKRILWYFNERNKLHNLMIMMLTNKLTATPENWKKAQEMAEEEIQIYAKR